MGIIGCKYIISANNWEVGKNINNWSIFLFSIPGAELHSAGVSAECVQDPATGVTKLVFF